MVRRTQLAVLALLAVVALSPTARAQSSKADESRAEESDQLSVWLDGRFYELWKGAGVEQKELVDDATFLRRVSLDLVGTIPSVAQTRDFLADNREDKRKRIVEQLAAEPRSAAHLSRVWRRILVPNGSPGMVFATQQLEPWLKTQFASHVPYDKLARELITARGNVNLVGFRPGAPMKVSGSPVAFYMAVGNTPDNAASSLSRVFLGVRIGCAKCHNHPFADWKQEDFWGMAAFFAGANIGGQGDAMAKDMKLGKIKPMDSDKEFPVRFLWNDAPAQIPEDKYPRDYLAEWLASKQNPNFAATAVNRVWQQLCGQGLIPQVDDLDQATPKQRAEVLDDLARQFADSGFDLQWLIQGIIKSRVYQRATRPAEGPVDDSPLSIYRPLKTLSPEQVFDSLEQALMLPVARNDSQSPRYNGQREPMIQRLNEAFSDSPDQFQAGIPQALMIMNGILVSTATDLEDSRTLRAVVDAPFLETREKLETLYLSALTRLPDAKELETMLAHVDSQTTKDERRQAFADIYWALLNSPEFILSR